MEHGHVVVHYPPDTDQADVARLRRHGADVPPAPYPGLDRSTALTASAPERPGTRSRSDGIVAVWSFGYSDRWRSSGPGHGW